MSVRQRYMLEYTLLGIVAATAIVLGAREPVQHLGTAQAASNQFSVWTIFSGNLLTVLCILLGSIFSGGFLGAIILFVNLLFYGRVLKIYAHASIWTAIFPWLEFIALVIAAQIGSDLFWSLIRGWPFSARRILLSATICPVLLLIAALIEGGILHV